LECKGPSEWVTMSRVPQSVAKLVKMVTQMRRISRKLLMTKMRIGTLRRNSPRRTLSLTSISRLMARSSLAHLRILRIKTMKRRL
jgi:hypothetical protein